MAYISKKQQSAHATLTFVDEAGCLYRLEIIRGDEAIECSVTMDDCLPPPLVFLLK